MGDVLTLIVHLTTVHPRTDTRIRVKEVASIASWYRDGISLVVQDSAGDSENQQQEGSHSFSILDAGRIEPNRFLRMTRGAWRIYRKVRLQRPEIAHFHDPELIPVGFALKIAKVKVIYDVHEDVPHQVLGKRWLWPWVRRGVSLLVEGVEKIAALAFDGIVAATPTIAKRFPDRKTVTVKNFPIMSDVSTAKAVPYSQRPPDFAYVGGISGNRGVFGMVEAVGQCERGDVRLRLGGRFVTADDECATRAAAGWERVEYHGWLDRKGVAGLLSTCRGGLVVLHPTSSYPDAYPVKMFEYMAAGLPVIASDFPLWREIVEGAGCGLLVDPRKPEEIARAMEWILDNPEEAQAMGRRGREAVESTYNWEPEGAKLRELYASLLGNP